MHAGLLVGFCGDRGTGDCDCCVGSVFWDCKEGGLSELGGWSWSLVGGGINHWIGGFDV
jgi:hypothetical protein